MHKATGVVAALGFAACAQAQYSSDFEALMANPQGVVLTGQDGYFLPVAGSTDFEAFTYAGNAYRLPQNPNGGTRFIAGTGEANATFERAERNIVYPSGVVTMSTDIAATYTGALPSAQNIGSLSVRESAGGSALIQLARWADPATASAWNADMVWFDAAGTSLTEVIPDPAFQNLSLDRWYTWSVSFDTGTNQVLSVSITDIVAGTTATHNPQDRYLIGGSTGAPQLSGIRFFAGGGVVGNTLAFDNIAVVPAPGALALLALGGLAAVRRRR